jgi:hypothetical protein
VLALNVLYQLIPPKVAGQSRRNRCVRSGGRANDNSCLVRVVPFGLCALINFLELMTRRVVMILITERARLIFEKKPKTVKRPINEKVGSNDLISQPNRTMSF